MIGKTDGLKICRHCGYKTTGDAPIECPDCDNVFETQSDFYVRLAASTLVILCAIYLWQKVLIGL